MARMMKLKWGICRQNIVALGAETLAARNEMITALSSSISGYVGSKYLFYLMKVLSRSTPEKMSREK